MGGVIIDEADPPCASLAPFPFWWNTPKWEVAFGSWVTTFGEPFVERELTKAYAWEQSNPSRRKTPRGRTRFLFNWLERAHNRGGPAEQDEREAIRRAAAEREKRRK